nr:TetR/AcrR family transcriptional regulator [Frankia gtarii]
MVLALAGCPHRTGRGASAALRPCRAQQTARRPLRADARRNDERILAAAQEAFAAHGASASLEEIARHAGVGSATLHRHFPSGGPYWKSSSMTASKPSAPGLRSAPRRASPAPRSFPGWETSTPTRRPAVAWPPRCCTTAGTPT